MGLDPGAAERMRASRAVIERLVAKGDTVYGVTTGFGDLANVVVPIHTWVTTNAPVLDALLVGISGLGSGNSFKSVIPSFALKRPH